MIAFEAFLKMEKTFWTENRKCALSGVGVPAYPSWVCTMVGRLEKDNMFCKMRPFLSPGGIGEWWRTVLKLKWIYEKIRMDGHFAVTVTVAMEEEIWSRSGWSVLLFLLTQIIHMDRVLKFQCVEVNFIVNISFARNLETFERKIKEFYQTRIILYGRNNTNNPTYKQI